MAQIVLSQVGAAVGSRLLPQGISLLGRTIGGAAIGRAVGAFAGRAIDGALSAPVEGPRVKALHVMESREGAGIPNVYGRMRVGGQVIWASQFKERRTTRSAGGKGGPSVAEYDYSVSFAVALCEGEIAGVSRAWANNEPFDLSGVSHRVWTGAEDQLPDPLIEMVEGAGNAPAYGGTAYVVFEDLPLEAFGNRLPQLSFEVSRALGGEAAGVRDVVRGVNIIPASGEFVYATDIVRERQFPGEERALNLNTGERRADFLVSLDQLQRDLPLVERAALTVAWFGDDVAAGNCAIRPGVETRQRRTVPWSWGVDGETRETAYLISADSDGNANYGGTPADRATVQAITEMTARGIAVTLTPFLMMDAPGFPWRGRIGVSADKTAAARTEIDAFVGTASDWGYRRFILHHAHLAAEAGGVEAFLIGSEMRGLTRVRDQAGAFPFVEALRALAAEVRTILPGVKISYAADWTEYGAYVPGDGSGDVLFPLDDLWADSNLDFVGIDWYPPMGDWRDGDAHLDALAGFNAGDEANYLTAQLTGGEAFDFYYADQAAREAQTRLPINDSAHGEHFVFAPKRLADWLGAYHFARPGGVRGSAPTGWTPFMKPVRLSEIGFAAVDKAGNAPNVFYDPKSSESALPPFSSGARDDVFQARALAAALTFYDTLPGIEAAYVWAWDGRPFPAWPARENVWSDGPNWARGHWLNGRAGLSSLGAVVTDICARGGVDVDARALDGVVEGYGLEGVTNVRGALAALKAAFGFEVIERGGALVFRMAGDGPVMDVASGDLVEGGLLATRGLLDKAPGRARLTYLDGGRDFQPAVAEARRAGADMKLTLDLAVPLVMSASRAGELAEALLGQAASGETAELGLSLAGLALEPGDGLRVDDGPIWRIEDIKDEGMVRAISVVEESAALSRVRAVDIGTAGPPALIGAEVDLVVMDGPRLPGEDRAAGPLVAAYGAPWLGPVRVRAGLSGDAMRARATLTEPAVIGRLAAGMGAGPLGRWDFANEILVDCRGGEFESASEARVLGGANAALLETDAGWELVQFVSAELVGPDQWRLSQLLRGQQGSVIGAAEAGARLVLLNGAAVRADVLPEEIGIALDWAAGAGEAMPVVFEDRDGAPWTVGHLRAEAAPGGWRVSWVRRGADVAASWALPDAENTGRFAVEVDTGSGFSAPMDVDVPEAMIAAGAVSVRVAERGADLRLGQWVSIGLNAP